MGNGLTVVINGREAIPVRAIACITGWKSSPNDVAAQLARRVGAPFDKPPNTFEVLRLRGIHSPPTRRFPAFFRDIFHAKALKRRLSAINGGGRALAVYFPCLQ